MLEFRVLGPFTVLRDGQPLPIGGGRRRAFLALLVLHAGRVLSHARIADEIWNGEPPRTAAHGLEVHASELRKLLGADVLRTRPPGYALEVDPDSIDAARFQRLASDAYETLAHGDPTTAARLLADAEQLWHGDVLADIAEADFARHEARRLDEIHVTTRELAAEAELALGVSPATLAALRAAAAAHPYRERTQALLVRSLAAAGRQADALEAYAAARTRLVDDLGIEPGTELRAAQASVLRGVDGAQWPATPAVRTGCVLAVAAAPAALAAPVRLADVIAGESARELVIAGVIPHAGPDSAGLTRMSAACAALRAGRRSAARSAAFTTRDAPADIAAFGTEQDADLLVVALDEWPLTDGRAPPDVASLLTGATMNVAFVRACDGAPVAGVAVPFGGAIHDWAAAEIGALLARAEGATLRLLGVDTGGEDASRLLANVALALQRAVSIDAEPVLARPGSGGLAAAVQGCDVVVMGLSDRWRAEGLGPVRAALVDAVRDVVLVRRGLRPGPLETPDVRHRLAWSTVARA